MCPRLKTSSMCFASNVVENGLLIGVLLVLLKAVFAFEALEAVAAMIGALAAYVLKGAAKRRMCGAEHVAAPADKRHDVRHGSLSCWGTVPCLSESAPGRQFCSADETFLSDEEMFLNDEELVQLKACTQAGLDVQRAQCRLEGWKNKKKQAEAEVAQLGVELAELETDLSNAHLLQLRPDETILTRIDTLLSDIVATQLRVEEVEAEIAWTKTNIADSETEVTGLVSIQKRVEEVSEMRIESASTDPMRPDDRSATDLASWMWMYSN